MFARRVHENNTVYLVLTFLPYHMSSIFQTLLSILPKNLPPTLRFLHPYIESLASPPRHTIVYTASHNPKFSTVFNNYVVDLCRSGYHFPAICAFWATVTTESVVAMLDQSRSGRPKVQKENQEGLLLQIMPILNEALTMENVPDLQIGGYMVLTVLAAKVALSDTVLNAAMEAVVATWAQTTAPGLICLATLAEQREEAALPHTVLKALLSLEKLEDDLTLLKTQYNVNSIALGVILGVLKTIDMSRDSRRVDLVRSLLESELMEKSYLTVAIAAICSEVQKPEKPVEEKTSLTNLLNSLTENKNLLAIIESAVIGNGPDLSNLVEDIQRHRTTYGTIDESSKDGAALETRTASEAEAFQNALRHISKESTHELSFLVYQSSDTLFDQLYGLFILASSTTSQLEVFSNLSVLRKPFAKSDPVFLSFLVRFWCSSAPAMARAAAIKSVSDYFASETPEEDIQFLFPYVIYGLADPAVDVRRASTKLVMTLDSVHKEKVRGPNGSSKDSFGLEKIYGHVKSLPSTAWLAPAEAAKFVEFVLLKDLEESLLDEDHISKQISGLLRGSKGLQASSTGHSELRTSIRQAFFAFICGHTICTPLYRVRYRLLQILCQVEKVGSLSRTKALLPLLLEYADQAQGSLIQRCLDDQIEPVQLLDQVVKIVLPTDREGVLALQSMVEAEKAQRSIPLFHAANLRIQKMWPSMKEDMQLSISRILLELAVGPPAIDRADVMIDGALETLRTAPLSTSVLQSFIDICLDIFKEFQQETNTHKRRRTARGATSAASRKTENFLKRLTTTLELVEIAKPENHPGLIRGLFQVLADLQNSRSHFGTEMGYLQVIALESIHAIINRFEVSSLAWDSVKRSD